MIFAVGRQMDTFMIVFGSFTQFGLCSFPLFSFSFSPQHAPLVQTKNQTNMALAEEREERYSELWSAPCSFFRCQSLDCRSVFLLDMAVCLSPHEPVVLYTLQIMDQT